MDHTGVLRELTALAESLALGEAPDVDQSLPAEIRRLDALVWASVGRGDRE